MSSDFGYINARVRGLKSRLLGPEFYAQALGESTFDGFLATLGQTGYGQDLEEATAQESGLTAVDQALARNFNRITRSILNFTDGWPHDLVALLLSRYDQANIKAVARAHHSGRSAEEAAEALIPAGELKPAVLKNLAEAADLAAIGQILAAARHPLAAAVRRAARDYQEDQDLYTFELALDMAAIRAQKEAADRLPLPRAFQDYLDLERQAVNIRTALKLRGSAVTDTDALFIAPARGATQAKAVFDAIIRDEPEALSILSGTRFGDVAGTTTLAQADNVIRHVLQEEVRRLAVGDPLGPFVVLDYLRRKEVELSRLRLLARGKFYNVPRQQLETELNSGAA